MAATTPTLGPTVKISAENQKQMQHLSDLLHLLHHRNHNQHRRSTWYRHFSLFRRQLNDLLTDLTTLAIVPDTHLARHRKKTQDRQTQARIDARVAFWRDALVPRCAHAFSQLVGDNRFAVIGLVLMAVLSEVARIAGLVVRYEEMGQMEVVRVLERFAREQWDDEASERAESAGAEKKSSIGVGEDLGEALVREDVGEVLKREERGGEDLPVVRRTVQARKKETTAGSNAGEDRNSAVSSARQSREASIVASPATASPTLKESGKERLTSKATKRSAQEGEVAPPQKKKKKKKNAIDELFSGL